MYKGILFDMDGVLVDTRDWVFLAYQHCADTHGFSANFDALVSLFGQPLSVCYRQLVPTLDPEILSVTHRSFQRDNVHLIRTFDGVAPMLDRLTELELPLGIVTGRFRASTMETLSRAGLNGYFRSMVAGDDSEHHKPDPYAIHRILDEWQISPRDVLFVGDAPADILCGQRAGCDTAAALYGFVGESLMLHNPTHRLDKPDDLLSVLGLVRA